MLLRWLPSFNPGTEQFVGNAKALAQAASSDKQTKLLLRTLEVFGSSERAWQWMLENNSALRGRPPIEAIRSEEGTREVMDVLGRIEHGVIS